MAGEEVFKFVIEAHGSFDLLVESKFEYAWADSWWALIAVFDVKIGWLLCVPIAEYSKEQKHEREDTEYDC
jgi:hypothetical protein